MPFPAATIGFSRVGKKWHPSGSSSTIRGSSIVRMLVKQQPATRKAIPYVPCDLSTLAITTQRKSRTNRLAEVMRRLERAVSFLAKDNNNNGNNNDLLNSSASSLNSSFATAATDGDSKRSRTNNGTNQQQRTISHIVIGIRPPLVTHRNNRAADRYGHDLMTGMSLLLHALVVKHSVTTVLHVSSIAAVDHVRRQHLRSVRDEITADPSTYAVLSQPYDRFKRGCEELVELVCRQQHPDKKMNHSRQQIQQQSPNSINNNSNTNNNNIRFTNLRLGAIFSDSPTCIQCSALALQCYTGPYLRVPIDCNSSRNAASLIHLMLHSPHHIITGDPSTTTRAASAATRDNPSRTASISSRTAEPTACSGCHCSCRRGWSSGAWSDPSTGARSSGRWS